MNKYYGLGAIGLSLTGVIAACPAMAQSASDADLQALVDQASTADGAIALARRQAESGDITGAAATLERALLADPNANDVRIWYAGFLCQLDDPQGARLETRKLDGQKFSEDAWSKMTSVCGAVERPTAPQGGAQAGVSGSVAFGLAYDSDTLGAVSIQLDTPLFPKQKADGFGYVASARLSGRSQGFYDKGGVYGDLGVQTRTEISGPRNRYETVNLRAGYGRQSSDGNYMIGGVLRQAGIFGNHYVFEYGGQAAVGIAHTENTRLTLRGEAIYQDYGNFGAGAAAEGWHFDLGATWEKKLGEGSSIAVGASIESKDATVRNNAYFGGRAFVAVQKQVSEKGNYFNLTSVVRFIDFKEKAPVQSRKDSRLYARLAYGVPVVGDKLFLEAAASYTLRATSSHKTAATTKLTNFADYGSVGAELRFVWKFGK